MIRSLLATFVAVTTLSAAAAAQTATAPPRPVLRSEALITGAIVRVGDLVENAGIIANVPIFRAPDLGSTGVVPADAVIEAVRAHALIGLDTGGVNEVVVTRASRTIPVEDIQAIVARALSTRFNLGEPKDIAVTFEREPTAVYVEPNAKGEPRVAQIGFDPRSGRFDATLEIPVSITNRGKLRMSGHAAATVDIVTVSHTVERGAVLKDSDVLVERRPRAGTGRDVIADRGLAIGYAARNNLQPGRPLRSADLMRPELVQRNETVTLIYKVPGITLTVRGKAAEGGAEGDVIAVRNEQSKRTVQGVIVGPGRVVVSASSPRLAANIAPARPATGH